MKIKMAKKKRRITRVSNYESGEITIYARSGRRKTYRHIDITFSSQFRLCELCRELVNEGLAKVGLSLRGGWSIILKEDD